MITIIFAPPRTGKTVLMTYLLSERAFNRSLYLSMVKEIMQKNSNGFNLSIPNTVCATNYDCIFKRFGYSPKPSIKINPYRLGFANDNVKTFFTPPFLQIGITEAQKYFNSRMALYYPDWQSRFFEQHGHNNLDILLDTQRPMLIDVNIRELSSFIEVIKLDKYYDEFGKICKLIWYVRLIPNSSSFDKYMASGKADKTCFIEDKIVADYNVFEFYDSQNCKPLFYDSHFNEDFEINYSTNVVSSKKGYIDFLKNNDIEIPAGFYQKRSTN